MKTLGLAERRAIKEYQDGKYVELKKAIDAAAGFEVAVDVQWDLIAQPGEADSYSSDDYWTNIYFQPLIDALKSVTSDAMGKDSLKEHLKQVVVTYDTATAPASNYPDGVKFVDGILTLNFTPWSNAGDVKPRTEAIQKTLEASL